MARILVTDGEHRSALAVVRSLGRAGHQVVVCAARARPLAGASRYAAGSRLLPPAAASPAEVGPALERIVREERIDLVVPMTDMSASFCLDLRERNGSVLVAFPERAPYELASDKRALLEAAAALGVPVPRQWTLESPGCDIDGLRRWADEVGFPIIAKPSRSTVRGPEGVRKLKVRTIETASDLEPVLEGLPGEAYPLLLQQRIVGTGIGAFVLAHEGRPLAWFGHRRLREKPPTGGVSVYREGTVIREDVREHTRRLIESLRWTGVAMVEFKEDGETGVPYLMEINGRFWGSLQLAIDSGVDFPRLLVDTFLDRVAPPVPEYRAGLRSRWLWGDVHHLLWLLRAPDGYRVTHPSLPGRARAIARFLLPWRPGDRFEILRARDPLPFVRESLQSLGKIPGRRNGRVSRA